MSKEIQCGMTRCATARLNPESQFEAYCYQMHDALQVVFAMSRMSSIDKRTALADLKRWVEMAEDLDEYQK